jgi:hypothetical protein
MKGIQKRACHWNIITRTRLRLHACRRKCCNSNTHLLQHGEGHDDVHAAAVISKPSTSVLNKHFIVCLHAQPVKHVTCFWRKVHWPLNSRHRELCLPAFSLMRLPSSTEIIAKRNMKSFKTWYMLACSLSAALCCILQLCMLKILLSYLKPTETACSTAILQLLLYPQP